MENNMSTTLKWEVTGDRQLFVVAMERLLNKFIVEKSPIFNSTRRLSLLLYVAHEQEVSYEKIRARYEINDATLWKDMDDLICVGYIEKVSEPGNARKKSALITERGQQVVKEWTKVGLPGYDFYD